MDGLIQLLLPACNLHAQFLASLIDSRAGRDVRPGGLRYRERDSTKDHSAMLD